ncbi:hypothetical protein [Carboxylicivirga marina]|uniref:Outer membrane protein beta-barrel domain-containing protein n=1 Tax=Carboxylicivirga marina TaxID=2800988 RepID=A0ABS1HM94_9BACT|nr:hypothetical protein [Carboxylicivirga marina]MBK3518796.1 hypothetical protein [Carboxylicivirga marina]
MKKTLFLILYLAFSLRMLAQEQLLDGYFTNRLNQKTNCQFLLRKWNTIPDFFEYRLKPDGEINKIEADQISELVVFNTIKFYRAPVFIDSIYKEKDQSLLRFETNSVLMQQLIEGDANLYMLPSTQGDKFFYSVDNSKVAYLMYMKKQDQLHSGTMFDPTITTSNKTTKNDFTFRSQLINALNKAKLDISYFQNLQYTATDLIDLFNAYNKRVSETHTEYVVCVRHKSNFRFRSKVGINIYSMLLPSRFITYEEQTINGVGYQAGVDMEVVFGKRNIWSVSCAPMLLAANERVIYGDGETNSHIESIIDYYTIQMPIAMRNYIISRPNWSAYIQGGAAYEIPVNAKITKRIIDGAELKSYNIKGAASFFASAGVNYKRVGLEYTYELEKDLMKMTGITVDFNRSVFSVFYRIK